MTLWSGIWNNYVTSKLPVVLYLIMKCGISILESLKLITSLERWTSGILGTQGRAPQRQAPSYLSLCSHQPIQVLASDSDSVNVYWVWTSTCRRSHVVWAAALALSCAVAWSLFWEKSFRFVYLKIQILALCLLHCCRSLNSLLPDKGKSSSLKS